MSPPQPGSTTDAGARPGRPAWATAIGLASVCFSAVAIVLHVFFTRTGEGGRPAPVAAGLPDWYDTFVFVAGFASLFAFVALATAGAELLRRHRISRPIHLGAALSLLAVYVPALVMIAACHAPWSVSPVTRRAWYQATGSLLIYLTYPAFLVVWFSRGKVRRQMDAW